MRINHTDILDRIGNELAEIKKVSDPSTADCINDIDTAIKFINAAIDAIYANFDQFRCVELVTKAYEKALDVLPEDETSDEPTLKDEVQFALDFMVEN